MMEEDQDKADSKKDYSMTVSVQEPLLDEWLGSHTN